MSFWKKLFGGNSVAEPVVVAKPIKVEVKTEAEIAIDGFAAKLSVAAASLSKARETLYDQKAQMSAKKIALKNLGEEIGNHKHQLAIEEEKHLHAALEDVEAVEIRAQNIQNTLLRKEEQYRSQAQTLKTLEGVIDVLERNVTANDIGLSRKQSELEAVRTSAAVLELNRDIQKNLPMRSFNVDSEQLEVFMERQRLELDDIDVESLSISYSQSSEFSLPFKERMAKTLLLSSEVVDDTITVSNS